MPRSPAGASAACSRRSAGHSTPSATRATATKRARPTQHPTVPQGVGPLAHGEESEAEDRDAVDGAAGPVDPGPEVAPQGLGQGGGGRDEAAEPGGGGGRGHRGDEPDHDAQPTWSSNTMSKAAPSGW